ncbi:restriction endonuclease [Streptomyces gilvosporeus]|uniref:Restriction endonuclease type IV Mrr domain-containing protein n=1 Tax=Streptomyces gilvosporeus TaxID=553510 RepID=A0A1V0TYR3_9ACTN|nr:restriction endonuclease [Streptomyces gilvosporeus]ARF58051.1 hypothetical protein B1H19_31160 [Streptomyces gilvosporeus]
MTTGSGKNYERQVMRHLTERDKGVVFELDIKIPDTTGSYARQVDIWLPRTREIVECKHHSRRVGVGVIDALVGAMDDTGAAGGQVFGHKGFTRTALARASKAGIECTELPYEERFEIYPEPNGDGYYLGDYIDLCMASTRECDSFGRINYGDGQGNETPVCVGHSVDWGNIQMHGFIAYVILSHCLARPPADWAISTFVEEYGKRFESGYEWHIEESEVSGFAVAA